MTWKIGLAKAAITPEKAVWLAGYGSKRAPEGKIHDLWAKMMAIEDQAGRRGVLVTSDLMGVPQYMYENIVAKVKAKHGLSREQLMLTFSHNHCGPVLREDLVDYYPFDDEQIGLVNEYSDWLENKIVETVGAALADLSPAKLTFGYGVTRFAANRRDNVEKEVQSAIDRGQPRKGVSDHSVPVLAIRNPDDTLRGILFGYACHTTTLSFMQWCGDYAGFAQVALEKGHPGVTAMFWAGCGADQNPIPRRDLHLAERYGGMLAAATEEVLLEKMTPVSGDLRMAFSFVDLDYQGNPTREELQAAAAGANEVRARWAKRKLAKMDEGKPFDRSYPYPIQAWRVGKELLWIALGAEAVVDYALRFKRDYGPNTWTNGYGHVLVAYMPSRRVWNEGGYEGGAFLYEYGHDTERWTPDVEDRIVATVDKLVRQVGQ